MATSSGVVKITDEAHFQVIFLLNEIDWTKPQLKVDLYKVYWIYNKSATKLPMILIEDRGKI